MRSNKGFTLIELIVVIVILGILSVVAVPKFMNFKGDAYKTTLKSLDMSIKSANADFNSKATLQGQNGATGSVIISKQPDPLNPPNFFITKASSAYGSIKDDVASLTLAAKIDPKEWLATGASPVTLQQVGAPSTCNLTYLAPTSANSAPTITINDSTCK